MRLTTCCLLLTSFLLTPAGTASAKTPTDPAEAPKPGPVRLAHIKVTGSYPEGPSAPGLFGEVTESLTAGIARLKKAADDDAVSGVILRIDSPSLGWGTLNEYRQAIARVRAQGKKVYALIDSAASAGYLLASACDEIIMPESGMLMLIGLRAEVTFYKNLFDTIGIKADMLRVGEFKSAAEPYSRTEMSPEFRKEMEDILDDYFRQIVEAVAKGRKLDRQQVIAAIDSGPLTASSAKKLGLIDHIAYEDELPTIIKSGYQGRDAKITRRYGKKKIDTDFSGLTGFVKMMNLMMGIQPRRRGSRNPKIAVIYASGMIMTGRSTTGGVFGGDVLGSDTLVKSIRKAQNDPKVKAIVLRVNSPGGSALASDLIWRALDQVDKPVVASMGNVAASGGYYISMGADAIFAEPGTLTGSIGVVGGKFSLKGLYDKIGITTTVISRGRNSGTLSLLESFTDGERQAMTKMLHEIYGQFTTKAAKGRKMEHAKLEKLARGRVYTGAMAVKLGLVDKLGTLEDAIAHAKSLAGLKPGDKVDRMLLPKPISPLEQLFGPRDTDARMQTVWSNALLDVLPAGLAEHLKAVQLVDLLARERRLMLIPFRLTVK